MPLLRLPTPCCRDTHARTHAIPPSLQAKQLLARYGSAYLLTSISFAVVSMAACYLAVDAGVDVAALLERIGLNVGVGRAWRSCACVAWVWCGVVWCGVVCGWPDLAR